jgi:hypothetical protein
MIRPRTPGAAALCGVLQGATKYWHCAPQPVSVANGPPPWMQWQTKYCD